MWLPRNKIKYNRAGTRYGWEREVDVNLAMSEASPAILPACKKVLQDLSEAAAGEQEVKRGVPSSRLTDLPWMVLSKGKVHGWTWILTVERSVSASGYSGKNYQQEDLKIHLPACVSPPLPPTLTKIYFWRVESGHLLLIMLMFRTLNTWHKLRGQRH